MIARIALCAILCAAWLAAVDWGYHHAVALHVERQRAQVQAVTRARDMQRMDDTMALRRCQTRVLMDYEYEQTAIMVAHSALKQAGMER